MAELSPAVGARLGMVKDVVTEPAPEVFEGEALVVVGHDGARPVVLAALHHTLSSTGPYVELVLGRVAAGGGAGPAGWLPAFERVPLAVGSRVGLPRGTAAEPATLKWFAEGRIREVLWEERDVRLRTQLGQTWVPGVIPARLVSGSAAARERRVTGRLVVARVEVEAPAGDVLAALAGHRTGVLFSTAVFAGETYRARLARRLAAVAEPS